jgi:ubiquinone biosynthesis monooxygenase Coq7
LGGGHPKSAYNNYLIFLFDYQVRFFTLYSGTNVIRNTSLIDRVLEELQHGLNTCHARPPQHERPYPAKSAGAVELTDLEQKQVAGLMRVNNAGEVAAQGLYRGQALTARDAKVSASMAEAAEEENEHLNWCQHRLSELNASRSKLDGFWYWGSFSIGALAGVIGDKWSLGFVEETEKQVCSHLESHLSKLPEKDNRSRAILETMQADEQRHAVNAHDAGATELPQPVKKAMTLVGKIMTFSAYRL